MFEPRQIRLLAAAALLFLVAHQACWWLQTEGLLPLQAALGIAAPFPLIDLQHGLRTLAAWFFGLASVIVMLPAALIVHASYWQGGGPAALPVSFHATWLTYLLSAPAAFALLRLTFGAQGHPQRFEWRMILLAGFISAFVNAASYGLAAPSDRDSRETVAWLLGLLMAQGLGVLAVLLGMVGLLRLLRRQLSRDPD